jgi:hypothetical protein
MVCFAQAKLDKDFYETPSLRENLLTQDLAIV